MYPVKILEGTCPPPSEASKNLFWWGGHVPPPNPPCLPRTAYESERSISALRRVFNYNRTTMGLNRLRQISLLAIESDILESITNNDVIDYFASLKPSKIC